MTTPEDLAAFPNRYAVEREIEAAENPVTGTMHLNDGHERVRLPGGTLRRMLAVIDQLAAMASSAQQGEPVAWRYEVATCRYNGVYGDWQWRLTMTEPCMTEPYVSEAEIRNLSPLYTHPTAPAAPDEARLPPLPEPDYVHGDFMYDAYTPAAMLAYARAALQANDTTQGKQ